MQPFLLGFSETKAETNMKTLNQNIHTATLLPIGTITETTEATGVDTYLSNRPAYDSGLIDIAIGDLGDQTSTKVKIEESDAADFSSGVSVAVGGDEITVSTDTGYKMQIDRKKRYLRAVVTIDGGSSPSAEVYVGALLWNAQRPFPFT